MPVTQRVLETLGPLSHVAGVAPLLACLWMRARKREPEWCVLVLSAAFGLSFLADNVGRYLWQTGQNNWWVNYVYVPIQLMMVVQVVAKAPDVRLLLTLTLGWMAVLSALQGPLNGQELVVQGLGGLAVWFLAWRNPDVSRLYPIVRPYFLWAVVPVVCMALAPMGSGWWVGSWTAYQLCRLIGLSLMLRVILRPAPRLEVVHGRRTPQTPSQFRSVRSLHRVRDVDATSARRAG